MNEYLITKAIRSFPLIWNYLVPGIDKPPSFRQFLLCQVNLTNFNLIRNLILEKNLRRYQKACSDFGIQRVFNKELFFQTIISIQNIETANKLVNFLIRENNGTVRKTMEKKNLQCALETLRFQMDNLYLDATEKQCISDKNEVLRKRG